MEGYTVAELWRRLFDAGELASEQQRFEMFAQFTGLLTFALLARHGPFEISTEEFDAAVNYGMTIKPLPSGSIIVHVAWTGPRRDR